jgi:flagellar motor switch protein FliN/FliY
MATTPNPGEDDADILAAKAWDDALQEQMDEAPQSVKLARNSSSVFNEFSGASSNNSISNDIDFILDIPVQLTVELGRTKISIKNLLQLAQGSVVELNGMAGAPMDVLINGCIVAQGEVVVVNEKFGIRLTDIITPTERIRKLNR